MSKMLKRKRKNLLRQKKTNRSFNFPSKLQEKLME